jgi:hypothetical protein
MEGFIFRLGTLVKNLGKHLKCNWLIRLGLNIREFGL